MVLPAEITFDLTVYSMVVDSTYHYLNAKYGTL